MKKMFLQKVASLGLVSLMAAGLVTGCGNSSAGADQTKAQTAEELGFTPDASVPSWTVDKREDTTKLTWYVNADWWNTGWGDDVVTKKIKEDMNIDIEFIVGDDTTLNTCFAGGDMPDLITIFDSSSAVAQKANTWAYPLDELADAYDPYFYSVASPESMAWFTLSDGKTYGYPDYSNTAEDYESGDIFAKSAFVIRSDIYEALGQPKMQTQEEFLDVLNQIKDQYPDVIPFGFNNFETDGTSSLGDVLQDFLGVPLENSDGSFYDRNLDEDYLSWLRTLNQAYQNGCISDDSFTDDNTMWQEKISIGKYGVILMDGTPQQSGFLTTYTNDSGNSYIAVDGPKSTVGNAPTLNQSGISGWMISYITKECSDPAKAIELFSYLLSDEGQILTTYGIEGETYTVLEDGSYALTQEMKDLQVSDNDRFKKEIRLGEFIFFGHDRYKALSNDSYPDSIKQMQAWGEGKLYPHFILENTDPDDGTVEARSYSAIKTNWSTTLVSLIRSANSEEFDTVLETYKTFLADNNWDAIKEVKSEKMQANKAKLSEAN
ncbi:MAG: sugar ABC transporter substrate-binding protein [Pseudobutyrivibrio sp.]|nr:sugar ABC transporter substrate-binding protein [Pseudobutyrivibrio sp.]